MFARIVSIHLKPNSATEFTQLIEKEALPLLRKAKGLPRQNDVPGPGRH